MPSTSFSLLTRLRDETQDLHSRVETRVDLHGALSNPEDYRRVLARFWGYYLPLEPRLQEWAVQWHGIGVDYARRRKVPFLERDLLHLGFSLPQIAALDCCPRPPAPKTFAEALGCAYVMEGATLGGQIIGRHLERTMGLRAENGASFFQCYGSAVGAMWQQFRRAAESYAVQHGDSGVIAEQAVAGARQTFLSLDCWLAPEEKSL